MIFTAGSGDLKKSPSGSKNSVQPPPAKAAAAAPVRTPLHTHNGIDPRQHDQLKTENADLKEQVCYGTFCSIIYL